MKNNVGFFEQADGTWHKMSLPDGLDAKKENFVFEGKYRVLPNKELLALLKEDRTKADDFEMFFTQGSDGFPVMNWAEKID